MHSNGCDFAFVGLIENEPFAGGGDAQDQAARFGAHDQVVVTIDGHGTSVRFFGVEEFRSRAIGRNLIDQAGIAGGNEEVTALIECHGPDVFAFGIEEEMGLAVFDAVDFGVGQHRGIELVVRIHG